MSSLTHVPRAWLGFATFPLARSPAYSRYVNCASKALHFGFVETASSMTGVAVIRNGYILVRRTVSVETLAW